MADVLFSSQFWQVRSEVPGVPEPILAYRYAQAVKDFLHESEAWRLTLPSAYDFTIGETFPNVAADLPTGTYIVRPVSIRWVINTGSPLTFTPRDVLEAAENDWEAKTDGQPKCWTITQPGVFRLYPTASVTTADALRLRVALSIKVPTADRIPEELMREWDGAFTAGALMNLLKMPGKDWTDVNMAATYGDVFQGYIDKARARAAADYGRPVRAVRYGGI